jgi:hypothetical protein
VKQKKAGLLIAAINQSQGVVKEILMPALENVGASAREDVSGVGRKGAAGGRA